jgi:hypothetical protein
MANIEDVEVADLSLLTPPQDTVQGQVVEYTPTNNYADILPVNIEPSIAQEQSKLRNFYKVGKQALLGAAVTFEVLPITNEGSRYAALAATEAFTRNPLIGAAVFGGATLLIEGAGAIATSDLITGTTSNKLFTWLNEKVKKHVPEGAKLSLPIEAGVALTLGTPIAMAVKQQESPDRTREQARRRGLLTAAWVAGVCAVEGAMISEGIGNYADPKSVGAALLTIGAIAAVPAWVKKALNKQDDNQEDSIATDDSSLSETSFPPRYDLTPEELSTLQDELVGEVKTKYPEEGVVGVWINPKSKFANFIRMNEASYFPEVSNVTAEDEGQTLFLALVDTRPGVNRVVHGATITGLSYDKDRKEIQIEPENLNGTTGLYTIDSLVDLGNFTTQEFVDYYAARGVNTTKSISVETNFRIGAKADKFKGLGASEIAYLKIFNLMDKAGLADGNAAVFATINRVSMISFGRVGINYELLMGRDDFRTEEAEHGKDSTPVAITSVGSVTRMLSKRINRKVPELFI